MKKITTVFILLLLVTGIVFAISKSVNKEEKKEIIVTNTKEKPLNKVNDTISIIGVGDMMLGTNYPSTQYLPPNDGKDILSPVKDILINANVTFGNLEGSVLDSGGSPKNCKDPSKCYVFRMPTRYVNYLKEAGFDVVSNANNHAGDFGDVGRTSTMNTLKNAGLHYAGQTSMPYTTFEIDGIKYGFCAFAPNSGTIDMRDIDNAKNIVKHLDSISDIVIVSFHGGAEGATHRNVTRKTEIFLGEDRGNVYVFSHALIDAGADVIFGHGPHITRAIELYKNRFIAYSLGNFCTYARFSLSGYAGVAPIIKVFVTKTGEFIKGQIFAIKQPGEGGPIIDNSNKVIKEIIELTTADFPETELLIKETGEITKK